MIYSVILVIISAMVIIIGRRSAMLRTEIFNIVNFQLLAITMGIKKPRPAFSLGRTQLAFWTVIIVSSFIYTVVAQWSTGISVSYIDPVNFVLLGIAGSTTAFAKMIDNSQQDNQGKGIPQQDYPSSGFFMDIISDEKGVSIHRLQNVIWTVVVGVIYISAVFDKKLLPDHTIISKELLGLMGVSAGAYIGLKTTENRNIPVMPSGVNAGPQATGMNSNVARSSPSILAKGKKGVL